MQAFQVRGIAFLLKRFFYNLYLLIILDSFKHSLITDGTASVRIDAVSIASRPGAEARIKQRVLHPRVESPAQHPVEITCFGIPTQIG